MNSPAVRTERLVLTACLSLLAACAPRAADSADEGADAVVETRPADEVATAAHVPLPTDAVPDLDPASDSAGATIGGDASGMPDSREQLDRARAEAGCDIPETVYDLNDIRVYCALPADARAFLERENTCQHVAGEEAYDEARGRELAAAAEAFCNGRERLFAGLLDAHGDDCSVRLLLLDVGRRYDLLTGVPPDDCPPGISR
ncbi:hypothetical protein [Stenotrophomonas sp.]|uniref:hypothetical protein n=1 Tax=Stenotrophomonas sp. TaxID=69392 RepID=UPI0028ACE8F3|nr:hypothetical protein [Stenotrophomonas sp.]